MKTYKAPWGKSLKWITGSFIALTLISALLCFYPNKEIQFGGLLLSGSLLLVLIPCAFFVIRSYTITGTAIRIQRLTFTTTIDLTELESAKFIPKAMEGSLRTCGNGGLLSWTGKFWNKTLGSYRAYVTDLDKTVVLRFKEKTILLSPENPESFVKQLTLTQKEPRP